MKVYQKKIVTYASRSFVMNNDTKRVHLWGTIPFPNKTPISFSIEVPIGFPQALLLTYIIFSFSHSLFLKPNYMPPYHFLQSHPFYYYFHFCIKGIYKLTTSFLILSNVSLPHHTAIIFSASLFYFWLTFIIYMLFTPVDISFFSSPVASFIF